MARSPLPPACLKRYPKVRERSTSLRVWSPVLIDDCLSERLIGSHPKVYTLRCPSIAAASKTRYCNDKTVGVKAFWHSDNSRRMFLTIWEERSQIRRCKLENEI